MGVLKARSKLQLVDEEKARARIQACSLAIGEMMPPLPGATVPAPAPSKEPAAIPGS